MLDNIKQMINEKAALLEAADIIMGSTDLDDAIILGEASDASGDEGIDDIGSDGDMGEEAPVPEEGDDGKSEENPEGDGGASEEPTDDLMNAPIDGDITSVPPVTDEPTPNNILDTPIDGDTTGLPNPVGVQTGGEIDPTDDILSMSIDMRSNTPNDTLPIPPAAAGDAIASDSIGSQRVDSGFEDGDSCGDGSCDPSRGDLSATLESLQNGISAARSSLGVKSLSEAISLGGDDSGSGDNTDENGGGDIPADAAPDTSEGDSGTAEGEGENTVTSAVRDKVAESEPAGDAGGLESDPKAIFKKLSTITKNVEDAKAALMNLTSGT